MRVIVSVSGGQSKARTFYRLQKVGSSHRGFDFISGRRSNGGSQKQQKNASQIFFHFPCQFPSRHICIGGNDGDMSKHHGRVFLQATAVQCCLLYGVSFCSVYMMSSHGHCPTLCQGIQISKRIVRQEKKIERKTDRDRGRQRENRKRMLFYYNIVITMGATSMGESDLFVNPSDFSQRSKRNDTKRTSHPNTNVQ